DRKYKSITVSRDSAGKLLVNNGDVKIHGPAALATDIGSIEVFGHGGDDVLTLDESNGVLPAASMHGGAGNDLITGGSGADLLVGGDGSDLINGRRGADVAFMGDGNDTFVWNPGDGNDVVEGESGFDTMVFNGANASEKFDFTAQGNRLQFV